MANSANITANVVDGVTISTNVVTISTTAASVVTPGKGDTGDTGATGLTGPQGATGPQGPQGDPGPQGAQGDTGAVGPEGPQGLQGDPGVDGIMASIVAGTNVTVDSTDPANPIVSASNNTFDVTVYGAVGDDTTNDTTAIQAALDAADTAGGGVVFFPNGIYKVNAALVTYEKVSLLGEGSGVSIIKQYSTSADTLTLSGAGVVACESSIKSLGLTGPGSGSGDGIAFSGAPLCYLTIEDISVQDFGGTGVHLSGLIVSTLDKVLATTNLEHGIWIDGTTSWCTSVSLNACYGNGNYMAGIFISKATYMNLTGCAADSNGIGYYFLSTFGVSASGCGAESNLSHGVAGYVGDSFMIEGDVTYGSTATTLSGCYSYDVHHTGFVIKGTAIGVTLVGCHDNIPHAGYTANISTVSGTQTTLVGCTFEGTTSLTTGTVSIVNSSAGVSNIPNLRTTNILDNVGNAGLSIIPIASAVNGIALTNAATGGSPLLTATGTDTNISLYLQGKGTGDVRLTNDLGELSLNVAHSATPVNYVDISSANTGNAVPITVTGSDTDVYMNLVTKGAGTVRANNVDVATISGTQTLTNKRITKRVGTTTSSATPTINTDNVDIYRISAQTVDITSFTTNLSGTPTDGQTLLISITGTAARAITWGASFESSTVTLPTTTVTTARLDVGFIWNTVTSKWRCLAVA